MIETYFNAKRQTHVFDLIQSLDLNEEKTKNMSSSYSDEWIEKLMENNC